MTPPRSSSTITVVIATYGDLEWEQLGHDRAKPSAEAQEPDSIICVHLPDASPATLARARNIGAEGAIGDWLCFLDADDELAPGYLKAMREAMHRWNLWRPNDLFDNPKLFAPALQHVEKYGRVLPPALPNRQEPMSVLNHCVIGTLLPKFLFREVGGFREDLPIYEDWALFLACVRAGATVEDVPDAVYRAHMRDGSRNRPRDGAEASAAYVRIRGEHLDAVSRGAVFI